MLFDYFIIFIIIFIAFFLGCFIYLLSYLLIERFELLEKASSYECGFEPFEDTRGIFEVRFYLVAILFVTFDSEVIFSFPWILIYRYIGYFALVNMSLFSFLLGIVYIYEWIVGSLDW